MGDYVVFCPLAWMRPRAISTPSVTHTHSLSVSPPPTTLLDDTPNKRSLFFSCRLLFFLSVTLVLAFAFMQVLSLLPPVPSAALVFSVEGTSSVVHVGKSSCQTAHNHYFFCNRKSFLVNIGQPTRLLRSTGPIPTVQKSGCLSDIRLQLIISNNEPPVTLGYGECRRP